MQPVQTAPSPMNSQKRFEASGDYKAGSASRGNPRPPCVLVRSSCTMREDYVATSVPIAPRTKAYYRRKRLKQGLACWDLDRRMCAEATHRVAVLTFTVPDEDPEAARGWIRDFWRKVRQRWLGTRYFCWLELQRRGAVHYHAVWLNPPPMWRSNLVAWVHTHWGHGRTQVRFKHALNGLKDELEYAMKYTDKMKWKAYQQRYDEVPSTLRTFMCQRLEIPPSELRKHLSRPDCWYIPATLSEGHYVEAHLLYAGELEHVVPLTGYCTAYDHRRVRKRAVRLQRAPAVASRVRSVRLPGADLSWQPCPSPAAP